MVSSNVPDSALISYGFERQLGHMQAEIQDCRELVSDLNIKVKEQQDEMKHLKTGVGENKGRFSTYQGITNRYGS